MTHNYQAELKAAIGAARVAGQEIAQQYGRDAKIWNKTDNSPVTTADLAASDLIAKALSREFPDDSYLDEERKDDRARCDHDRVWIIDPLDGTREFVHRTDDFAVHIALAVNGAPVVGVVYKPIGDELYEAVAGHGAFVTRQQTRSQLRVSERDKSSCLRIGITRFAETPALTHFREHHGELQLQFERIGASSKYMALARGEIDACICLHGRETEWDTCAPELIVGEAGGRFSDVDCSPFHYNRPTVHHLRGIVVSNGQCHNAIAQAAAAAFDVPTPREQ